MRRWFWFDSDIIWKQNKLIKLMKIRSSYVEETFLLCQSTQ